jgi:hypothetical protein
MITKLFRMLLGVASWGGGVWILATFWFPYVKNIGGINGVTTLHGCLWPLLIWTIAWTISYNIMMTNLDELERLDRQRREE